ncbi:CocE/NonD family hydrolase [Aliivibrio salmonicida]|uniref:X-Pro dipeptidyl-peptidase n=1 Tax=Aliivibrio salmonicida (strain LFI1238) TaxID=316275 RepID=B6EJZ1_ALISL|nr:CocE/NonD family hydrolase [Aliivibrio salmonicida]AZL84566.1 CocE/NonD family hydrolase [Aliivibrio salmonicida]CAQ78938.1 X-Pro dipeptidyl-peptidase [Aliivibrio salmonicida LFI1238]
MNTVKEIHHDYLTLPDGTRLAYRAWMPEDAHTNPVPAILEFLPYRKNDGTIIRDEITMPQTAAQGYACVRVDLRGCGESEGFMTDEYSTQELQDGCDVITWIAAQAWCNGNLGMVGISWGGFNSLQVAALNPPALKAIITQCSTDDRYRDDIHFNGGCLLNDNMDWAAFFWAYAQGRSPDKALVGENWKEIWLERLENMPFLAKPWLTEQIRNDYWKHGSVCEKYSDIKIPVYAMGGWADGYRNTVFTLLQNLDVPTKGLVGPWAHKYPNIAFPNPKMDYVKESVRWWDRWLKGIDNGIMDEPKLNYYLQDSVTPATDYDTRPGKWVSEPDWPSDNTQYQIWHLSDSGLKTTASESDTMSICSPQTVGLDGGRFCAGIRLDMEHPADQRIDDSGSLVFDSLILEQEVSIAGQVLANLNLSSDKPQASVIVRISDVHPNGQVTKVSHGILNLTHRDSHEFPQALNPDERYDIEIKVNHMAYVIPKGHKIRIAISTAYWPLIWPTADNATLTVYPQHSSITLPVNAQPICSKSVPEHNKTVSFNGKILRPSDSKRVTHRDYKTGVVTLETMEDFGRQFYESSQSEIDFIIHQELSIHPDDPLSAKNDIRLKVDMGREGWWTGIECHYEMICDHDYFYITANWKAFYDNDVVFEKQFTETIKRHFM